jgi:L-asparagine oxygenase
MEQAPAVKLNPPTVIEVIIPPESLEGFEAEYERVAASWPADLATTTDDLKLEDYISSAHTLVRRWLPADLLARLERFIHDPNQPPALVIRGLPIDRDLPPTQANVHEHKMGRYMSETWLVGIARVVGQVFTYESLRGKLTGPTSLVRQIYTTAEKVNQVSAEGSKELLDFHLDFFQVKPQCFPNVIAFMGIRGAEGQQGKTLLCDNRLLYNSLSPSDIEILRKERITWKSPFFQFSRHVIEGSEEHPQMNLFEENLPGMKGFDDIVQASPEAKAAYKRVKEIAATIVDGVWLDSGDVLLLNQRKACHGRGSYEAKYDGTDRWLQRTYTNSGGFWEAGLSQWPRRTIPNVADE